MAEPAVTVVDYGAGNVGSVMNMLKKIGVPALRAQEAAQLKAAKRLILPGVGAFDHCMQKLADSGLRPALEEAALKQKTPLLGICVGFQMMYAGSEEGTQPGLGWLSGKVVRFDASKLKADQKVPHMGWDRISALAHPLFFSPDEPRFYFVHSYHAQPDDPTCTIATCNYGYEFTCAAQKENILGVQFHPEKSHRFGMQLLRNFAGMTI